MVQKITSAAKQPTSASIRREGLRTERQGVVLSHLRKLRSIQKPWVVLFPGCRDDQLKQILHYVAIDSLPGGAFGSEAR
jgi:hypothetical protein